MKHLTIHSEQFKMKSNVLEVLGLPHLKEKKYLHKSERLALQKITFWWDNILFFFNRTTMGVWMGAITQPTVRVPLNSAGTSLTTTRCPTFPPPQSSPPQPTFCFTPPSDGAVGPAEEPLHLGDDAHRERLFNFPLNKVNPRTGQAQLRAGWSCMCKQVHSGEGEG